VKWTKFQYLQQKQLRQRKNIFCGTFVKTEESSFLTPSQKNEYEYGTAKKKRVVSCDGHNNLVFFTVAIRLHIIVQYLISVLVQNIRGFVPNFSFQLITAVYRSVNYSVINYRSSLQQRLTSRRQLIATAF
jgi:hypothetical protein